MRPQSPWEPGRCHSAIHRGALRRGYSVQTPQPHRPRGLRILKRLVKNRTAVGQTTGPEATQRQAGTIRPQTPEPCTAKLWLWKGSPMGDKSGPGELRAAQLKPDIQTDPGQPPGPGGSPGRREPESPRGVCHLVVTALRNPRRHWTQARIWAMTCPNRAPQLQNYAIPSPRGQAHSSPPGPAVMPSQAPRPELLLPGHLRGPNSLLSGRTG